MDKKGKGKASDAFLVWDPLLARLYSRQADWSLAKVAWTICLQDTDIRVRFIHDLVMMFSRDVQEEQEAAVWATLLGPDISLPHILSEPNHRFLARLFAVSVGLHSFHDTKANACSFTWAVLRC